jgi:hypothetical protein
MSAKINQLAVSFSRWHRCRLCRVRGRIPLRGRHKTRSRKSSCYPESDNARPAAVSRTRLREEPSTISQCSATARYIAASTEASLIFKLRATSCSMTGCKAPPSTDERATSATIRRARSSSYCMAANAARGASVPLSRLRGISRISGVAGAEMDQSAAAAFALSSHKGPPDPTMARALTRGSPQEAAQSRARTTQL